MSDRRLIDCTMDGPVVHVVVVGTTERVTAACGKMFKIGRLGQPRVVREAECGDYPRCEACEESRLDETKPIV